mmetsp:Transcript_52579/g.83739  ORF Transcript_52579/g.83739 Transcript_52579/m.83739 type:complete len:258 (+) Transcript_52579:616-1389(+)
MDIFGVCTLSGTVYAPHPELFLPRIRTQYAVLSRNSSMINLNFLVADTSFLIRISSTSHFCSSASFHSLISSNSIFFSLPFFFLPFFFRRPPLFSSSSESVLSDPLEESESESLSLSLSLDEDFDFDDESESLPLSLESLESESLSVSLSVSFFFFFFFLCASPSASCCTCSLSSSSTRPRCDLARFSLAPGDGGGVALSSSASLPSRIAVDTEPVTLCASKLNSTCKGCWSSMLWSSISMACASIIGTLSCNEPAE